MHLYIIRHGKAQQESPTGRDRERGLAPRGERQAEWLGEQLGGRDDAPTRIVSSPFVRADQTARLVNNSLAVELAYDDRLIVDEPTSGVFELIGEFNPGDRVALVGHNPQLSRVCGMLAKDPTFEMKTGMCAVFGIAEPRNAHGNARLVGVMRMD